MHFDPEYDPEVAALDVAFRPEARSARTMRLALGINVDFDAKGRLLTLEVLWASQHVPKAALEGIPAPVHLVTLKEAAKESGRSPATLRVQLNRGRRRGVKRGRDWLVDGTAL